jgi:hypothetical protein
MKAASDFLRTLGKASGNLNHLALELRRNRRVARLKTRCDILRTPGVEWYVDTELETGDAISRRLLVYWANGHWELEGDVSSVTAAGQEVLRSFARSGLKQEQLETALEWAIAQLRDGPRP